MLRFGIITKEQLQGVAEDRRKLLGPRVAYNLLDVGGKPDQDQVLLFEQISFSLQTTNGTYRTTFRNRFEDLDRVVIGHMKQFFAPQAEIRIQDRAVSHGLTSAEWANRLFPEFPQAKFEASDLLVELIELTLEDGSIYILEPDGKPLQYIKHPFVVPLSHFDSWRYPVNRWVATKALERFKKLGDWRTAKGARSRSIAYVHPEALDLSRSNPNFTYRKRSIFDTTPGACDVLRTMNIFNWAYFSKEQMGVGKAAAFESLRPGGLWVVGRTLEENFTNHMTLFRRNENGWDIVDRIGDGSEIESFVLSEAGAVA